MAIFSQLVKTYDNNKKQVANFLADNYIAPISHMMAKSQIEVSIDMDGVFLGARAIEDKKDADILIPVTEASSSRSSGVEPHPLSDNLTYVAGDFSRYVVSKKEKSQADERFEKYKGNLHLWANSDYSTPTIKAIYKYISLKRLTSDLIKANIIKVKNGELATDKIQGTTYNKCIVRFRVVGADTEESWRDKNIIESYIKYYLSILQEDGRISDICYSDGENAIITNNHPKGILSSSYGAKIISANDTTDFTYRGRFKDGIEACSVSYEASQKAHNALKWIVKTQSFVVGGKVSRTYICWNPNGIPVPQPDILGYEEDDEIYMPQNVGQYREKMKAIFNGHKNCFDENDTIAIAVLEAATTGRLSIIYYSELTANDYFSRIESWYENCCWEYLEFDGKNKPKMVVRTPSINQIVKYSFGIMQDNNISVSDKLCAMEYQRIFSCMINKQPIPRDIVENAFRKVNNPYSYSKKYREDVLSTACAIISKYYVDKGDKEGISLDLDRNYSDRDYLYGRLLAVYEKLEERTYNRDEGRQTNAIRYQNIYSQRPATTRLLIEHALNAYKAKLSMKDYQFFMKEIEEISNLIGIDNENKSLGYKYLTGYYAERSYLRYDKSKEKEQEVK